MSINKCHSICKYYTCKISTYVNECKQTTRKEGPWVELAPEVTESASPMSLCTPMFFLVALYTPFQDLCKPPKAPHFQTFERIPCLSFLLSLLSLLSQNLLVPSLHPNQNRVTTVFSPPPHKPPPMYKTHVIEHPNHPSIRSPWLKKIPVSLMNGLNSSNSQLGLGISSWVLLFMHV